MTTAAVDVVRAGIDDAQRVGTVLAAAFADDPVFGWLIPPDAPRRERRINDFFTGMARSYLRRGKNVYLGGGGGGAAMWSAPGSWALPLPEVVREWRGSAAFGRNVLRALRSQLQIESLHPKTPQHWYLGYLGTTPERQGQGIGAAMLREVLDQADANGIPAYLESSNERNLTLYERHGFRVVEQLRLLGISPPVWRMWRDPS